MRFYYFSRQATKDCPAGVTVSKRSELPSGDFRITEYVFTRAGYDVLWFVDRDTFTAEERDAAWRGDRNQRKD